MIIRSRYRDLWLRYHSPAATVLVSTPVVAHFETNVVSGCSPLEIQFEDQSEGHTPGIMTWAMAPP